MTARVGRTLQIALDPAWLAGPIFDKELRVSSRRRRNYSLRFFYILVLTIFIAIVWLSVVHVQGNATIQQARMADAGKRIVATIVLFQFVAMQILAVIMLSNAISDEVYHRTLGLLMTTPISSLQIVLGKVLSRLLQLILLLAISLPILAIARVLGGVSWGYLVSSLCVTLTTAIFAGSLSLLFSVKNRFAYGVITRAMFTLGCLHLITLPPLIGQVASLLLGHWRVGGRVPLAVPLGSVLVSISPLSSMLELTRQLFYGGLHTPSQFSLPLHGVVMLGLSALVLAWAVVVVRKVALRQATGQLDAWFKPRKRRRKDSVSVAVDAGDDVRGAIMRVQGPPVVWRELRAPFIHGVDNRNSYIGLAATVAALFLTYLASWRAGFLDEGFVHVAYVLLFVFLGVVVNTIFATTRITAEKESQSWLLLLATPLNDGEILFGKAVSSVRRCLPIWGLLAGHVVLFALVGYIHVVAVVHLVLLVASLTCFITGGGLYFGARFARTTSAVVAGFGLILGLWAAGPIVVGLLGRMAPSSSLPTICAWAHPAIQAGVIVQGAGGRENAQTSWRGIDYDIGYPGGGTVGIGRMTGIVAIVSALYVFIGLLFFWRARCRLRRHVFT